MFKKKFRKIGVICMTVLCLASMMVFGASATGGETGDVADQAVSAVQEALGEVTGVVTISTVLQFIGIALGAGVGFFLMWFGVRWVIRKVTKAIKSGRLG